MKTVSKYILIGGSIWAIASFCAKQTDGFSVASTLSTRASSPLFETRPLTETEKSDVASALEQTYSYFGKGGQSYVFFSEDGKYVLKLFRQRRFELPLWLKVVRIPYLLDQYRERKSHKRTQKLERDFMSYKASFEELQEETAVIYVHLNKTDFWKRKIKIVDRVNIQHSLNVDQLDFLIQKRAELVHQKIDRLMREGKREEAEKAIKAVFDLILRRRNKGFSDRDPNIITNCGFVEERAVKIDVGPLAKGKVVKRGRIKKDETAQEELVRVTKPLKAWLQEAHPVLIPSFEEELIRAGEK